MTPDEKLSLADKLYRTKYEPDPGHPHVTVDAASLKKAKTRKILKACPAGVYTKDPNDPEKVAVSHENCLECGTCRQAGADEGVEWKQPDGGKGVKYRYG
ncbi:MAG: ferredoxin family protein [Lentisphaerae bacterium]|nr:ferredoxin family protein [Lentisphaerota bacterium]